MILLDALYINDSGGKILLDYLIESLENKNKHVIYLLDERVRDKIPKVSPVNRIVYIKASLKNRGNFYRVEKNNFTTVLCFGNLPPPRKLDARVYTYFHQFLYLALPKSMPFLKKRIYEMKAFVFNCFKRNTTYWFVQTDLIKKALSEKYKIRSQQIIVLPFYPEFVKDNSITEPRISQYLYVSSGMPHKNHIRLIEAFSNFFMRHKTGKLILTISDSFPEILELIKSKQSQGVRIENIGFVKQENLQRIYLQSEFLVFPSLAESFGLGLVEAIENGCKVIGADLPYTYAVCEPSITFDPLSVDSIYNAFCQSLESNIPLSENKTKNEIDTLISQLE